MQESTHTQGGARCVGRGPGGLGAGVLVPDGGGRVRWRSALATVRIDGAGRASWVDPAGGGVVSEVGGGPLEALGQMVEEGRCGRLAGTGWAGFLGYELGGLLEARTGVVAPEGLPLGEFHRVGPGAGRVVGGAAGSGVGGARLGSVGSVQGRSGYVLAVGRALGYIRAGDVYQAYFAHELGGRVSGSAAGV
ncbi:MAG: hypothetical protein IT431_00065 [Phycisphaerales bacterium]|nr:hypothetical protein [Phycisphaerales bacterium]